MSLGLADVSSGEWRLRTGFLKSLYERELAAVEPRLASRYGPFRALVAGQTLSGTLVGIEELPSGAHAVVAGRGHYALVPVATDLARSVGRGIRISIGAAAPCAVEPRALAIRVHLVDIKRTRSFGGGA